ncbi:MAG: type VI secretion system baseplate subunit TssG [Telluria sp.]
MREPADPVNFLRALEAEPWRFDFCDALRRIECLFPQLPRIGQALRPRDEPIRLGQDPSVDFAPAALSAFRVPAGAAVPLLQVRFFGLLGPNGPLPLHLSEFVRARALHDGDPTALRFLDLFTHRFLALFYRAWAQARPTASLDRPGDDRFALYPAALCGLGEPALRGRTAVAESAKLFYSGLLARQVRNRDGLAALLSGYFRLPVEIEEFVGHWLALPGPDRSSLGRANAGLGRGALLGARIWDCQYKFRVRCGPLDLDRYESFLPGGAALPQVADWVRQYLGFELDWDLQLLLVAQQVPRIRLGRYGRLGWTTWLGRYRRAAAAADLTLDVERVLVDGGGHGRDQPHRAVRQAEQPVLQGH